MKYLFSALLVALMCLNLNAQKSKYAAKKGVTNTTIHSGKSKVITKSNSYKMVFPQYKNRYNAKSAYILTREGERLKIGDGITTQWSRSSDAQTGGTPTAYGYSTSNTVEFSNGGRDVTITTTTTSTRPDGSSTSETTTTKVSTDSSGNVSSDTSVSVTNTQGTSGGNSGVVVVIVD